MNMSLSTQQRRLELLTDAELTAIIRDSEQFLEAPKDEWGLEGGNLRFLSG